jgi:hypothetical protein
MPSLVETPLSCDSFVNSLFDLATNSYWQPATGTQAAAVVADCDVATFHTLLGCPRRFAPARRAKRLCLMCRRLPFPRPWPVGVTALSSVCASVCVLHVCLTASHSRGCGWALLSRGCGLGGAPGCRAGFHRRGRVRAEGASVPGAGAGRGGGRRPVPGRVHLQRHGVCVRASGCVPAQRSPARGPVCVRAPCLRGCLMRHASCVIHGHALMRLTHAARTVRGTGAHTHVGV